VKKSEGKNATKVQFYSILGFIK